MDREKKIKFKDHNMEIIFNADQWSYRPSYGWFTGSLKLLMLDDGRNAQVLEIMLFTQCNGRIWPIYPGNIINGSNIPSSVWSWIKKTPYVGRHRLASAFHDAQCVGRTDSPEVVHRMFYDACMAAGEDKEIAQILYQSVSLYGPWWGKDEIKLDIQDLDEYHRGIEVYGRL